MFIEICVALGAAVAMPYKVGLSAYERLRRKADTGEDCSAELQQLIDETHDGTVRIPPGTYHLTQDVDFKFNMIQKE